MQILEEKEFCAVCKVENNSVKHDILVLQILPCGTKYSPV